MKLEGQVLGERYRVGSYIGAGSFCTAYFAYDITSRAKVVAKFFLTSKDADSLYENELRALQACQGVIGVPTLLTHGDMNNVKYIITNYGGIDLVQALFRQNQVIEAAALNAIAQRLIATLEGIHSRGFLHLDIKPDNILVNAAGTELMLIDYGFAKRIDNVARIGVRGNVWFCGTTFLSGLPPTRWSDLESLAYTIIMIEKGSLPWAKCRGFDHKNVENCLRLREQFLKSNFIATVSEPNQKLLLKSLSLQRFDAPNYARISSYFCATSTDIRFIPRGQCGVGKFYPLTMITRGRSERRVMAKFKVDAVDDEPRYLCDNKVKRKGSVTCDQMSLNTPPMQPRPRLSPEVRMKIQALKAN